MVQDELPSGDSGLPNFDDAGGNGGNIEDDVRVVSSDVSCENCAHRDVCAVYKGIEPMFREWAAGQGDPPFDLNELAVICDHYLELDDE